MAIDPDVLKKTNNIYIENSAVWYDDTPNSAPYFTLAYAAHGKGKHIIDGLEYEISEGDIILVKPDIENCFIASSEGPKFTMYYCLFMPQALPCKTSKFEKEFPLLKIFFSGAKTHLHTHDTPDNEIRNLFVRMIDDFTLTEPCSEYTIKSRLTLALVNIFKLCSVTADTKQDADIDVLSGIAINYIKKNIYRKLSLKEVADFLHISPTYLCHVFRKHVNMSFVEFTNHIRVERIKDALEYTDRPIHIICEDFDFSKKYLNMIFKKSTGYTLTEYKKIFNYKSNNPLYAKLPDYSKHDKGEIK